MSRSRIIIISVLVVAGIGNYFLNEGWKQNMKKDPDFKQLIGKKYETNQKLKFKHYNWKWTPYLVNEDEGYIEKMIRESDPDDPFKYLEKGSVFQITKIILHHRPFSGSRIWIKTRLIKSNIYQNRIIDVTFIADSGSSYTEMDSRYVTEVISDEGVENENE
jgi:hypothetical protein